MYRDNIRHNESSNSLALENASRKHNVKNLRTMDTDSYGFCSKCLDVIYNVESTSAKEKSTLMTRKIAQKLGSIAVYVYHEWEDRDNEHPIYIEAYMPDGTIHKLKKSSWEGWNKFQEWSMNWHEKQTGCSTKKAPFFKELFEDVWVTEKRLLEAGKIFT